MKVLQINTICGSGSVGRITVDIVHALEKQGDEGMVAFGRRTGPEGIPTYKFGTDLDMGFHSSGLQAQRLRPPGTARICWASSWAVP